MCFFSASPPLFSPSRPRSDSHPPSLPVPAPGPLALGVEGTPKSAPRRRPSASFLLPLFPFSLSLSHLPSHPPCPPLALARSLALGVEGTPKSSPRRRPSASFLLPLCSLLSSLSLSHLPSHPPCPPLALARSLALGVEGTPKSTPRRRPSASFLLPPPPSLSLLASPPRPGPGRGGYPEIHT